ncbi:uncharacterized protein LOC135081874 [Ostrinia nubilalis]|uniref:uncharacterized protein LOC135081874 n=1 Tax=Ostrinia nubilalis TaxID=29057 RepID=UPI003082579D
MNPKQFGFKEQTSTVNALNQALKDIQSARQDKKLVIAVSMDIQGAFNNAWWPKLLQRLQLVECPQNIYKLITNYLNDRTVTLNYADSSASKTMTRGCIQGSVCGPSFWNIILDELFERELPSGCKLQAYADDVLLICTAKDLSQLERNTNTALEIITAWGESAKLTFGPTKTQMIGFTPTARKACITHRGIRLQFKTDIKLLGIIIDQRLTFTKHVDYTICKALKIYRSLCKFVRPTWGVHSQNISTIYQQVIQPIITYAAGIWGDAIKFKKVKRSLLSLQRGFAVKIIRGFRTVSTIAAISLARLTPLDLKVHEVCVTERAKLSECSPYLPSNIKLQKPTPPAKLPHPAVRQGIKFSSAYTEQDIDRLCPSDGTKIFTDGSKLEDGKVGAAYVIVKPNQTLITYKLKLHNSCTVFQAELLAIERAVRWATESSNTERATVLSDSHSALQELANMHTTNSLAVMTHNHLRLHPGCVEFVWVKAHAGLEGNETADEAAKSAASSQRAPDFSRFPISHVKRGIQEINQRLNNDRYITASTGALTRNWLPNLDNIIQLFAQVEYSFHLTQILTGHGYHRQYLHRFKIAETDKCNCDPNAVQDILHLLKDCPRFIRQRVQHMAICQYLKVKPFEISDLLKRESTIKSFIELCKYIVNNLKEYNST